MESKIKAKRDVIENTKLCADRGWKATFYLDSGEVIDKAYITGTDWDHEAISVEKVGERHKPAQIIFLNQVNKVEVGWT